MTMLGARAGERSREGYWAVAPAEDLASTIIEKVEAHDRYVEASGLRSLWSRMHEMVQSGLRYNRVTKAGRRNQYDLIKVNELGNILQHIVIGITGVRPTLLPSAMNGDYTSQAQVKDADAILEYQLSEQGAERRNNQRTENMCELGEGFTFIRWDKHYGQVKALKPAPDGSKIPVYAGDIRDETVHTIDVVRDWQREEWENTRWLIIRRRVNRWDLAQLYADDEKKHQAILDAQPQEDLDTHGRVTSSLKSGVMAADESDEIWVYHFLHDVSPAVPFGRWVTTVSDDADGVLSENNFKQLGVEKLSDIVIRSCAIEAKGKPTGYTVMYDLMAIQEAINTAESTAYNSLSKFGMQHITGPAGAVIKPRDLGAGLKYLGIANMREGKIEGLNLMALPEVILSLIDRWRNAMERISGVNSVRRGDPEAALKSGAALALVESRFNEFNQGGEREHARGYEQYGTTTIKLFQTNCPEPRIAGMVGKGKEAYVKELKAQDVDQIRRVKCEIAPAIARTAGGKVEMATELLGAELIDAEEYVHVRAHGELNSLMHRRTVEPMYIQRENETLLDPRLEVPEVIDDDDHALHLARHKELLFNPEIRTDAQKHILDRILAHNTQHKVAQARLAMAGIGPDGQPLMLPPPGDPAAAAGAPPGGPESGTPMLPAGEGAGAPAGGEQIPLDAINPATGAPASVRMPAPTDAMRSVA